MDLYEASRNEAKKSTHEAAYQYNHHLRAVNWAAKAVTSALISAPIQHTKPELMFDFPITGALKS